MQKKQNKKFVECLQTLIFQTNQDSEIKDISVTKDKNRNFRNCQIFQKKYQQKVMDEMHSIIDDPKFRNIFILYESIFNGLSFQIFQLLKNQFNWMMKISKKDHEQDLFENLQQVKRVYFEPSKKYDYLQEDEEEEEEIDFDSILKKQSEIRNILHKTQDHIDDLTVTLKDQHKHKNKQYSKANEHYQQLEQEIQDQLKKAKQTELQSYKTVISDHTKHKNKKSNSNYYNLEKFGHQSKSVQTDPDSQAIQSQIEQFETEFNEMQGNKNYFQRQNQFMQNYDFRQQLIQKCAKCKVKSKNMLKQVKEKVKFEQEVEKAQNLTFLLKSNNFTMPKPKQPETKGYLFGRDPSSDKFQFKINSQNSFILKPQVQEIVSDPKSDLSVLQDMINNSTYTLKKPTNPKRNIVSATKQSQASKSVITLIQTLYKSDTNDLNSTQGGFTVKKGTKKKTINLGHMGNRTTMHSVNSMELQVSQIDIKQNNFMIQS